MSKFIIPNIEEENTITKTIRIRRNIAKKLEELAIENNITFNRLVNECIDYALQNMEEDTNKEPATPKS
uniref:YlcI/YnfO family protein n=1 Tax=Candidatus Onthocola sp. TaxID=3085646 RepID=UPI003FEFA08A